ncbi:hypothetical protein [Streptomyces sp. NBC_01518]|uniref:hypothetical protein n=1 Tax=Streptomyces sp. NBC_01518 TaxID=2903891 RepID=UPI00386A0ACF
MLLKLWPQSSDPDGFCAGLLAPAPAPALARENRTSIRLRGMTSLTGLRHLTSLRGLETLGFLKSLWLADCPALHDFAALTQLSALDELGLEGLGQLPDLTPFAAVPGLASLYVIRCDGLVTLEGLERQDDLADLVVYQCRNVRCPGELGALAALRRVRLNNCPSLTGLDGLGDVPALRELHVVYCELLVDPGGLAGAPVEDVVFARMPNLGSLHALENCPDLRRLELIRCPPVENIPAGPVTELNIDELDWRDLSPLAGHKNLRHLWLDLPELEDISALLAVPDLITLHVGGCDSLKEKDLAPLLDLPSLRQVTLPYGLCQGGYPARYLSLVQPLRSGAPEAPRTQPSPEWSVSWCTACSGWHPGGSGLRLHCPAA